MSTLRQAVIWIIAYYVRIFRRLHPTALTDVLVIPAASKGSLGDQALLQGIQNYYFDTPDVSIRQALSPGVEEIPLLKPCRNPLRISAQSTSSDIKLLLALRSARLFCVTGADVTDGRYSVNQSLFNLHCLEVAEKCGTPARLLGFSFSEKPESAVINRFASLSEGVALFARDPVSRARFMRATKREIFQSADLAFLMTPAVTDSTAADALIWLEERRAAGSAFTLALNANALTWNNPDEIVSSYCKLILHIVKTYKDPSILLVPHDSRGRLSDYVLHQRMVDSLPPDASKHVHSLTGELSAWSAKALAARCDLVVTGRMHFAIAALDTLKPVVCIGYMGKFEGLLGYFQLETALLTPIEAYTAEKLITRVDMIRSELTEHSCRISENVDRVRALACVNLDSSN